MAWMIREDQLDSERRDFINQVTKSIKSFVIIDKTFQNQLLIQMLGYIIKNCKERNIIIVFPNNLLLSQFKNIIDIVSKELRIENKSISFKLINEIYDVDLTIYFLFDQLPKDFRNHKRFLYFTTIDLDISGAEKFSFNILHRYTPSLKDIATELKKNETLRFVNTSKIDTWILTKTFKTEEKEFKFIVDENKEIKLFYESSIILFANNLFLNRFINHLMDYAQFDVAEYNFNDFEEINNVLEYYGLPYVIIHKNTEYYNLNNIDKKSIVCTYSTAKYIIDIDKQYLFIPQTNRVSLGLKRSNELADYLISTTPKKMFNTSSYQGYNHNSITKIFNN